MGFLLPVRGTVTQRWGYTGLYSNGPYRDNRTGQFYERGFHTGLDISAPNGTIIRNVQHGVVHVAAWEGCEPGGGCWGYGGGYVAIVRHNSTPVYSSHAHMQSLYVKPGQPVYRGQPLGQLDTRGFASGPHDHYAIWVKNLWWTLNGAYTVDPMSAYSGALASSWLLKPATCRVPKNVNLRTGPGTTFPIIGKGRMKEELPMFKETIGGAVKGYQSRKWRLVYFGRWAWVFKPLTTNVRSTGNPDDLPVPEIPVYSGAAQGVSLSSHEPSIESSLHQPDPDDGIQLSRSAVSMWSDAGDAF